MTIQANFPAIKPSLMLDFANTKQLDPRITYTRASTATFYNGVTTAKAEENLFLNSQNITTAGPTAYWNLNNSTNTANSSTAPDGTSTATLILPTNTAATSFTTTVNYSPNATGTVTISIYVKPNTYVNFGIREQNVTGAEAAFSCTSTGSVLYSTAGSGTGFSATITQSTNGFYRCSITVNVGSGLVSGPRFFVLSPSYTTGNLNTATWTSNGTDGMYYWGAQLEQRSAVTAYTATTTQAITNYIPVLQTAASGVARFDNNPTTGESLGLLIEESRTNLYIYSEQLNNGIWNTFGSVTISTNTVIAPDGTLTSDTVLPSAATGTFGISQNLAKPASSITYTLSGFSKSAGYDFLIFRIDNGAANGVKGAFNISTATVSTAFTTNGSGFTFVGTSLTSVGNGWVRWSVSFTTDTSTTLRPIMYVSNVTGDGFSVPSFTANGFSGMFIWGAQLEAGSFATSYIPTVASQVTRAADAASMTGTNFSSWYNAGEGTIYSESNTAAFSTSSNDRCVAEVNDTSSSNFLRIQRRATSQTSSARCTALNSDVMQLNSLGSWTTADYKKVIVVYKFNDAAASADAGTVSTDTSFSLPVVTKLEIGSARSGDYLCGTIKKIAYYPLRVTNAQLQALSS